MKKTILIIQLFTVGLLLSSAVEASGGGHKHYKKHGHHHDHYVGYAPQPGYYGPPPRQDPRSHQGLAGGVVGSVLGYEIGNGDPIATGLGAAAGSYLGNGMAGRH
ncbi:MAG: glycine zipper 2TM domain-containing protein [Methylococcaceae bacterium]|nr:glycine zipper 2TM domain-containing protein [Methylococcaceae bacterium]